MSRWYLINGVAASLMLLVMVVSCQDSADRSGLIEEHKKLAGELRDTKLYAAAIEEYQKILAFEGIDVGTRANINYLIARIYFENLADYRRAAAYYVRARSLDPEGSFYSEASKNLVTALERSGQLLDARRELGAATDMDRTGAGDDDVMVARIGDEPIWLSEIEQQIQTLPDQVQKQVLQPEEKARFIQQYVGMELMYRAAVREDYGSDPEILRQQEQFHRQLLVNKYVLEKVMPGVRIDTMDVRNYYEANRGGRYQNAPYDSVRAQVFVDYQSEKAEQAFTDYVQALAEKEKVEFFEHNIR